MLFDNGILELVDGNVTLQTPRDSVDKNGMFRIKDEAGKSYTLEDFISILDKLRIKKA